MQEYETKVNICLRTTIWLLSHPVIILLAGIMGAHLVADFADGSSNVREIWKFFFK